MKYRIRDHYTSMCERQFGMRYKQLNQMDCRIEHWHDCCEIELILSGHGIHLLNGKEYPFREGELFILTPLDCHTLVFDTPVKLVNIMLEESYISDEIYEKLLVRKTLGLENHVSLSPKRQESAAHLISVLYSEYERFQTENDPFFEAFASRIIDSILIELIGELHTLERHNTDDTPSAIGQAILYIHNHGCEKISLSDVASNVHLSAGYFSELFKKTTDQTFKNYLIEFRIKNACRMLTKTDWSVTDICFACGFESYANFMRTFKAKRGISPLKYRQKSKTEKTQ